jgi:hypothetical protein
VAEDVVSDAAVASPAEITADGEAEVIRTQLELDLAPGATTAEVNALLDRLGATVVSSLRGVGRLTVRIPDPGGLAALDALIASLAGDPALDRAGRAVVPVAEDLPEFILPGLSDEIRPQLAVRAHALWNARSALTAASRPSLVVGDYFGAGPPGASVAVTASAADFATGNVHQHGYLVLGLLAGTFDPVGLPDAQADHVTGLWAGPPLRLHAVDLRIAIGGSTFQDRLVNLIRNVPGNVVLSTSIGDGCAQTTGCSFIDASDSGEAWVEKIRAFNLDSRVVHASAGGNIRPHLPAHTDARLNSGFNAAALLAMSSGSLRNTLVVEDAIASPTDVARPMCLNNSSKRRGQISAVGTDVTSLDGPDSGQFLAGGGTSSATPQVAAAAATVWALNPSLSPSQVVSRLLATARPATGTDGDARCAPVAHAPALDAYGAVLAADDATLAPAREAVLDPVDADGDEVVPANGRFDEKDLVAFVTAFDAAQGEIDYGRYDLNGDGRTGGDAEDRVDLDASSPPAWEVSERRDILGLRIAYDETALTDLEILCHEAAGPLYHGDTAERDQFLAERCLPPVTLDVQFPSVVTPGTAHPLRISARQSDVSSPDDRLPGVHLDLTATGGTVDRFSGSTDADGLFETAGRMFDGETHLTIEIVARAGDGGPELARTTVHTLSQADADLLGLWQGNAGCEGVDPVPFHLRITRGAPGEPPLVASINQAGSNTGVISQEFWGLAGQQDGTYEGTNLLEGRTAVLQLQRVTGQRALSGHVGGAFGRCPDYDFVAFFVSN